MSVTRTMVGALCLFGFAGMTAISGQLTSPPGSPVVVQGKIDSFTGQFLIPVELDRASFWCSLDSGYSALIAVDQARAERSGLRAGPAIPTPDGRPPGAGDSGANVSVSVGAVSLGNRSIILRRLPGEAPEMECIMGVGVLRQFVVEMEYVTARLRLHDRATYRPLEGAQQIPLVFRTNVNVPFVQIILGFAGGATQMAQVVADTGTTYYGGIFVSPFVENVRSRVQRTAAPAARMDSSRPGLQFVAARLDSISVGPITTREPVVALIETGLNGGGVDDGTLGNGFFRRFTVAFDFEGRAMYLKPNERFSERQLFDASGVAFQRDDTGFRVDFVLPDSAGSRAGLRAGDRLLEVDGRAPQSLTPRQLADLMSRPRETRSLRLLRDGKTLEVTLILEERL